VNHAEAVTTRQIPRLLWRRGLRAPPSTISVVWLRCAKTETPAPAQDDSGSRAYLFLDRWVPRSARPAARPPAQRTQAPEPVRARRGLGVRDRPRHPYGHRNVSRRALGGAAQLAALNDNGWPPLRFHDLRHTFASHLIIDLGLDVARVSRILGHARITITLDIHTHLFEDARHAQDIRTG